LNALLCAGYLLSDEVRQLLVDLRYPPEGFLRFPFQTVPFDEKPIIPSVSRHFSYDSSQSVTIAAVLASADEEDPVDVTAVTQNHDLINTDQAFWYLASSHHDEDTFGIHGGFFGPTLFGAHVTPLFSVNRDASFVPVDDKQEITLTFQNISQSTIDGPVYLLLKGSEAYNLDKPDGHEVAVWQVTSLLETWLDDFPPQVQAIIRARASFEEKQPYVLLVGEGAAIAPQEVVLKKLVFNTVPQGFPSSDDSFKIYAGKVTGLPFDPSAFCPTFLVEAKPSTSLAAAALASSSPLFELTVVGPSGFSYYPSNSTLRVDVSTNLVDWELLREISPTNSITRFSEEAAPNTISRFYRLTWQDAP